MMTDLLRTHSLNLYALNEFMTGLEALPGSDRRSAARALTPPASALGALSFQLACVERVAYFGVSWLTRRAEHHPTTEKKLE